jgi:hypothetical protein
MPTGEQPLGDGSPDPMPGQLTAARHSLTADPSEVMHVVCCRDDPWEVSLCGVDVSHATINFAGDPCAMCVEEAMSRWRARRQQPLDEHCYVDGSACPSDEWIFNRVMRWIT